MELIDKVAIVTGASSGIGEAAAVLFAERGARVLLGARRRDRLEAVVARIRRSGGTAQSLAGDVCDASYQQALVACAVRSFGGVDIALNNAGILGQLGPLTEMSGETWNEVIATNLPADQEAHLRELFGGMPAA